MRQRCGDHLRAIIGIGALLALAACSTADYGKPVNDFAAATGNAEKALAALNTDVTKAYKGVLDRSILEGDTFLQFVEDDCLVSSDRCRLEVVSFETGEKEPYPPEPPLVQMSQLMAQIGAYAANLKSLVESDTAGKVAVSVNAALGSVQNLAETVAKASAEPGAKPVAVPPFATPVGAGVNWLVGQYVESVKYRGLQHATKAARPVIHDAAQLFEQVSTFVSKVPRVRLAKELRTARDAFRDAPNAANLAKLSDAAAQYDALLTAAPSDLFRRMGAAHDALADSLQGGEVTLGEAVGKIEAFAAQAQALAKILQDIRAVVPDDKEG